MDFVIQNQVLGLNDKFRGKVIKDMTVSERMEMEAFLRTKMNVQNFKYIDCGSGREVYEENANGSVIRGALSGMSMAERIKFAKQMKAQKIND